MAGKIQNVDQETTVRIVETGKRGDGNGLTGPVSRLQLKIYLIFILYLVA